LVKPESAPPELVGENEEGELWIGGIGVAAGYLKRPDLTVQVTLNSDSPPIILRISDNSPAVLLNRNYKTAIYC
jgi:acyl-CoA synthetase (AMP-forming)/AMP-acid ligase II